MASRYSIIFLLLLLAHGFLVPIFAESNEGEREEEFSEELLLKPLPDRKVLAHFHFNSRAPPTKIYGHHHRLFPKAIYQLVQKFRIREMELSFTQGRWNYERWGGFDPLSSGNAKPPGVELWAVFDVPLDQVDATWKNLTHSLSGLFCASINFLESSTSYSAPDWGFRSHSGSLRYGALPREAVCTENLTPWLKLLPCRDKAGLAAMMDRPSIYRGFYHSQRLRLVSTEFGLVEGSETGTVLEQTLTVVLQPSVRKISLDYSSERPLQPSWTISSLFGKKVTGQCVLAKSSTVFLELERGLVTELEKLGTDNGFFGSDGTFSENSLYQPSFELSVTPDRLIREVNNLRGQSSSILYEFSMEKYGDHEPFDLGFHWKLPVVWSCLQAPFHASRFLMGSGNERGSVAISLKSTQPHEGTSSLLSGDGCALRVIFFQVVPWYVKVYYHTLQIFIDGQPRQVSDVIEKIHVSPSEDKVSPGVMEMVFELPCSTQTATLTVEFDKGFLHIDEYPPDANQGFDIPSALISFPDFHSSEHFLKENSSSKSPLLLKLQERNPVQSYMEVLLVPLTTPDFSMPYNVITFTCTVLALYFGSLLNVLRRRVGEEERFLKSKAAMRRGLIPQLLSKLSAKLRGKPQDPPQSESSSPSLFSAKLVFKVILVAAVAIGCHYYLNDHQG
ncbi:GPI transamidase component Gpi16 subunit family protein [Tasmannia lanceolata]|uniref:GPI transamidase component Gpi16 subunit family protein n=1 Tax=Tasmannia lanceolata TaxID=3420 RepID=UPI0040643BF9